MSSRLLEETLADLLAKRPQTLEERAAIDAAIAAVVRGMQGGLVPTPGDPAPSKPTPVATQEAPLKTLPESSPFYGLGMREACPKVLLLTGKPMTPREIWETLKSAGYQSAHADPAHAVNDAMRRRARTHEDVLLVGAGQWGRKEWYTEAQLQDIKKSVGGMGGRDRAAHSEMTKRGMVVARTRGVRLGKELFFTPEREAEFERRFKAGETVAEIAKSWGKTTTIIRVRYKRADLRALRDQARRETEHEVAGETRH
jgi:hypothetical protein